MNIFLDTSVLAKLFHREAGSPQVERLHDSNQVAISELAITEFYSATLRKFREKAIDENGLRQILEAFDEHVTLLSVAPLSRAVVERSKSIIRRYARRLPIRSLDALQLSTYTLVADSHWAFVANDTHMVNLARAMGVRVINPCQGQ